MGAEKILVRICILACSAHLAAGGLNASWVFPTLGCFSTPLEALSANNNTICRTSAVCADVYLRLQFGDTLNFSLAATDNSSSVFSREPVKHCNDHTLTEICYLQPDGCPNTNVISQLPPPCPSRTASPSFCTSRPCHPTIIERLTTNSVKDPQYGGTGFKFLAEDSAYIDFLSNPSGVVEFPTYYGSPYISYRRFEMPLATYASPVSTTTSGAKVTNVYPRFNNLTRVDFNWTIPLQEDVAVNPLPLYQLRFRARYGAAPPFNMVNTSSCTKNIFVRICGVPTFAVTGSKFIETDRTFFRLSSSPTWTEPLNSNETFQNFSDINNASCGVDARRPCLTPAIDTVQNGRKVLISTFQESIPTALDGLYTVATTVASMPTMGVRVGQVVNLTVAVGTLDAAYTDSLSLMVFKDPGLPIGMEISPQYACKDDATVCVNLLWTPKIGQDNYVHEVHLVGYQGATSSIPDWMKPCGTASSAKLVLRFPVTRAVSTWVQPAASLVLGSQDPGNGVVGTKYSSTLQCKSNYNPLVQMEGLAEGSLQEDSTRYLGSGQWLATYNFSYVPVVIKPSFEDYQLS
jgi:hypothetical protein